MLVLSRKLNQSIMIGEDVEVVVLEIKGDAVKIGIKAPRTVPVFRQEVYQEIKAENVRAASSRAATDASALLKRAIRPEPGPAQTGPQEGK